MALTQRDLEVIVRHFFRNDEQILRAFQIGSPLPILQLRNGLQIVHAKDDPIESLFHEVYVANCYGDRDFYEPSLHDRVIDFGANIGVFALRIAGLAAGVRIFCFEPASGTRSRLVQNVRVNGLSDTISVFPYAVLDRNETRTLRLHASSGDSGFIERTTPAVAQEDVQCIDLKGAIELCGPGPIDLIKIDVEGAEVEVFQSADQIDWGQVKRFAIEFHDFLRPGCRDKIMHTLANHHFKVVDVISPDKKSKPLQGVILAKNKCLL